MKGHGNRNRHVDADHADLDLMGELACGIAVACKDCCTVAELVFIDPPGCGRIVRSTRNAQHGAEDLLFVDPHTGVNVIKQRSTDEIAILIPLAAEIAAVDDESRAFGDTRVHIAAQSVEMLLCDEGSHFGFGVRSGSYP